MRLIHWILRGLKRFSFLGLLIGGVFFAMSLTPSLIPRGFLFQGALAGVCFALGYGLGVLIRWNWLYLELPQLSERPLRVFNSLTAFAVIVTMLISLWLGADWQNSIRDLMGMEPVETGHPVQVAAVALIVALVLIILGRLVGGLTRFSYHRMQNYVPRRVAFIVGPIIVALTLINLTNGVVIKGILDVLDSSYAAMDDLIEEDVPPPELDVQSGSPNSLVDWHAMGRRGREFAATGPNQADISAFTGRPAKQPIRIYVGLNSADSIEDRAQMALAELKRVNAFARKIMVVVTPTGTGWVDPMGQDPVEYLHDGDIATVAVQYSYLSSPISLLAEPEQSRASAEAVFTLIYDHWRRLPEQSRPELYLNGLSLGSHGSEASMRLYDLIGDPIQGALWAGPPFPNTIHSSVTLDRNPGTPEWLPRFRDGSVFRFTSQTNALNAATAPWGPLRIVYLQYASDPIVFFDMGGAFRRSDWMLPPRGPDVSPKFTWYPVVTSLQLALDMMAATSVPFGFGHRYHPRDYIASWIAVTAPKNWDPADTPRLKAFFDEKVAAAALD
ncbi:MAG: alpha/beta hydrolase [Marinosulfonomonas sp.]